MAGVKRYINRLNVFLLLLVLGSGVAIVLGWPWDQVTAAAWVQAIGSVVAIVAAIVIASHQHESETSRLKAQERQRQIGLATRLLLFAQEYHEYVTKTVSPGWQEGIDDVDKRSAFVFDRLLMRLTSNFDDDLDPARCVQVYVLKTALTGLIFLLQSTNAVDEGFTREEEVRRYQSGASKILSDCKVLLSHADKTY